MFTLDTAMRRVPNLILSRKWETVKLEIIQLPQGRVLYVMNDTGRTIMAINLSDERVLLSDIFEDNTGAISEIRTEPMFFLRVAKLKEDLPAESKGLTGREILGHRYTMDKFKTTSLLKVGHKDIDTIRSFAMALDSYLANSLQHDSRRVSRWLKTPEVATGDEEEQVSLDSGSATGAAAQSNNAASSEDQKSG